ncbi:sensor histidine kinase [uncultured Winogradskyella sp.]|uniref:tetratricopeptide repeat-containing sensor histidine kinase n=1 Tax=uncultured Winogradskyella sp. TaxID=395353 RepID=UPI0026117ECA|nr:sensor histidine kinase [uncultured Winogradskyella sp.]
MIIITHHLNVFKCVAFITSLVFVTGLKAQNDSIAIEKLYNEGIQNLRVDPSNSYKNLEGALTIINDSVLTKNKNNHHFLLLKANILDRLAYNYRRNSDYANSLKLLQESLTIKERINETQSLSLTYCYFGSLYVKKKDSTKTLSFFNKAMDAAKQYNHDDIPYVMNSYSNYYMVYKDFEKAKVYAQKAYKFSDSTHNFKEKAYSLTLLSRYYIRIKDFKTSIQYSLKALKVAAEINDKVFAELSNKELGYAYRKLGQPKKALDYYLKSLELTKAFGFNNRLANRYLSVSNAYTDLNQHEDAFSYYRLYKRQQIKNLNIKNIRDFAELDAEFKYKKEKLKDSLLFVQEKKLSQAKIETLSAQNKIKNQWLLFGGIGFFTLFLIIYLIRSKKFAISKQELQEQFSQDLINEQEKERSRISRELHDSVGQKLMLLSKTTKSIGNSDAESIASSTLEEIRSISRGLHPSNLERLGLTEAINALVYDINVNTDLFFTEDIENIDHVLPKEFELHLYRIIQETLSNIVRHSEAKGVKMKVNKTFNNLTVVISDNGKGFEFETKLKNIGLGLKTLFERAKIIGAKMNLDSEISKGTKMTLTIPI